MGVGKDNLTACNSRCNKYWCVPSSSGGCTEDRLPYPSRSASALPRSVSVYELAHGTSLTKRHAAQEHCNLFWHKSTATWQPRYRQTAGKGRRGGASRLVCHVTQPDADVQTAQNSAGYAGRALDHWLAVGNCTCRQVVGPLVQLPQQLAHEACTRPASHQHSLRRAVYAQVLLHQAATTSGGTAC